MTDPMIPGLDAAVEAAVNELRLTYNEGPGDLYDLVHDAIIAAYPHLIERIRELEGWRLRIVQRDEPGYVEMSAQSRIDGPVGLGGWCDMCRFYTTTIQPNPPEAV